MTLHGRYFAFAAAVSINLSSANVAHAQLCAGDSQFNVSFISTTQSPNLVQIFARSRLVHGANHINCSGVLTTHAHLWIETYAQGCATTTSGSAIGTTTSANHEDVAQRYCTVYNCSPAYNTRGYHYFNSQLFEAQNSNWAQAACVPTPSCNPCSGPGLNPGGGCPIQQQDPCGCCPAGSPLLIDRGGDGYHLSDAANGVLFNLYGRPGYTLWLGWPLAADDVWLALDRNGNGVIDDGTELFGNTRTLADGRNAENGFEVLAELDYNGDGVVDAADPEFARLLLWGDANRNGISEPSELTLVTAAGIQSLTLAYRETRRRDTHGNWFRFVARDRSMVDVFPVWRFPESVGLGDRPFAPNRSAGGLGR